MPPSCGIGDTGTDMQMLIVRIRTCQAPVTRPRWRRFRLGKSGEQLPRLKNRWQRRPTCDQRRNPARAGVVASVIAIQSNLAGESEYLHLSLRQAEQKGSPVPGSGERGLGVSANQAQEAAAWVK